MGEMTTMVSSASHPDHVAADESEADAENGTAAIALMTPTRIGKSRYFDLFLIEDMAMEARGMSVIARDRPRSRPTLAAELATSVVCPPWRDA